MALGLSPQLGIMKTFTGHPDWVDDGNLSPGQSITQDGYRYTWLGNNRYGITQLANMPVVLGVPANAAETSGIRLSGTALSDARARASARAGFTALASENKVSVNSIAAAVGATPGPVEYNPAAGMVMSNVAPGIPTVASAVTNTVDTSNVNGNSIGLTAAVGDSWMRSIYAAQAAATPAAQTAAAPAGTDFMQYLPALIAVVLILTLAR